MKDMLIQVISSWQVLAVTLVLVIYFSIVNYVARVYLRSPRRSSKKPRRSKVRAEAPAAPGPSETDDLGLEENVKESE